MTLTEAWPPAVGRLILDQATSTNDEARAIALSGGGPAWVLALEQTASRGRRGRAWSFQKGNFAASYLSWPTCAPADLAQMSFVAALALSDTVAAFAPGLRSSLKWPNDLLIDGCKLSGILLETVTQNGRNGLVTVIGVNLVHVPDQDALEDRAVPPVSVASLTGEPVEPAAFLDMLAPNMDRWERNWLRHGFDTVRKAWLDRSIGLGSPVVARLANRELSGIFETIDQNGSLVLSNKDGRHTIPAAEIYFPFPDKQKSARERANATRN